MIKLGLTGSIGMGKSTTANMFRELGIKVYDADQTVHDLYKNEAVEPISKLFPTAIANGSVDRKILSTIVLNDKTMLKKLEAVVHPLVRQKEKEFLQQAQQMREALVVLDIPLLFETGGENRVDKILVVTASNAVQKSRVLARNGMNEDRFNAILQRQTPDEEKRRRADYILDTGAGIGKAKSFVKTLVENLTSSDLND